MVTEPEATLKTVLRRVVPDVDESGEVWVVDGGGGTEKRARSWDSVSRIRAVISWLDRSAFVKIFGGGNLVSV